VSRRKLLLADDSVTIQKVVNLTFADEGVDVVAVGDGDSAMQSIVNDLPDIVLADVHMPGVNGYQICEMLRENEATRHIPVILLVGSFEPFDEAEAQRVGASAYLTKPFTSIRQLVAKVTELIGSNTVVESIAADPLTDPFAETIADLPVTDEVNYAAAVPTAPESGTTEDDIDRLYTASFATPASPNGVLADIGDDDDIIETSYTGENGTADITEFEMESRSGDPEEDDFPSVDLPEHQTDSIFDAPEAEHAPMLAAPDWNAEPISEERAEAPFTDDSEIEQPPEIVPFEEDDHDAKSSFDDQMGSYFAESSTESEPAGGSVNFEVVPSLSEPSPAVESVVGEDTIRMDERFDNTSSRDFIFDDVDLLDIPAETDVDVTTPAASVEDGRAKRLVTLSPELIEMIAQRVVEKLSEKYQ
jgi:CheY-like chemotaxis protein